MPYELSEQKKIGLGLIGFGIFFTFLAVLLFFDRGLLALGNIFWLTGVAILLGWRSTLQLFTDRRNYKGSVSFLLGIFFIFVRWPVVGILVEIYGCILLFGGFWPSIKAFLFQIPVLGWVLQYPLLVSEWKILKRYVMLPKHALSTVGKARHVCSSGLYSFMLMPFCSLSTIGN